MKTKLYLLENDGKWSANTYDLIEKQDDYVVIADPKGNRIRVFSDRVSSENPHSLQKATKMKSKASDQFDPSTVYPNVAKSNKEIWIKTNSFNDTTLCKTFVVIDLHKKRRFVINTYNGVARGGSEYPVKDIDKLVAKLKTDGYKKINHD